MQTVAQPALPSSLPGEKLGRYQPLVEVCKDPLGGLWLARIGTGKEEGKRVFVRRVAPTDLIDAALVRETCEYAFVIMEVKHESILSLNDVVIDKGHLGAACDFFEAETLMELMRTARARKTSIPLPVALRIASDVLHAFTAVHAFAAEQEDDPPPVHGGFNPYRVLVTPKGQVLLTDIELLSPKLFAAARKLDPAIAAFATPELGNDTAVLDARTDVYQVGALLWEMLSGNQLPSVVPAPRLEGVPESVADLVMRAMAVHQDGRFPTAAAMADAVHNAANTSIASSAELGKFVLEVLAEQFELQRKTIASTQDPKPAVAPTAGGVVRPGAKPVQSVPRAGAPPRPSGGSAQGLTPRPGTFAARLADRAARKDSVSPQAAPVSARKPEPKPTTPAAPEVAPAAEAAAADKPIADKPIADKPAEAQAEKPTGDKAAAAADKAPESKPAESAEAETIKHPSMAPAPGMEATARKTDSDRVDEIPPPARAAVKTLELEDGEMVEEGPAAKRATPPPAPRSGAVSAEPVAGPPRASLDTEDLDALAAPKSKKKMLMIVGGVVGVALLIVIIAIASGGSKKEAAATREGTPTDTTTATAQPTASATETAAATVTAAPVTASASVTAAPAETAAPTATATATAVATATAPAKAYVPPPTGPAPATGAKKPKFVPKGI